MHVLFEVLLVPGALVENLLSAETREDTHAQLRTREQIDATGFVGLKPDDGDHRIFIIVRHRDQRRIENVLNAHPDVRGFASVPFDL